MQASIYSIPEDKLGSFSELVTALLEPAPVQNPSHQWLLFFLQESTTAKYSQRRDQMNIATNISMHTQTVWNVTIAISVLPMSLTHDLHSTQSPHVIPGHLPGGAFWCQDFWLLGTTAMCIIHK